MAVDWSLPKNLYDNLVANENNISKSPEEPTPSESENENESEGENEINSKKRKELSSDSGHDSDIEFIVSDSEEEDDQGEEEEEKREEEENNDAMEIDNQLIPTDKVKKVKNEALKSKPEEGTTLFIRNLAFESTEENLEQL